MAVAVSAMRSGKPGNIDPAVLSVARLGRVPYRAAWELQRELQKKRIAKETGDLLLVCEHEPVITLGTSTKKDSLLVSEVELSRRGIDLCKVERGGDITYHGPGQLVLYPILDLSLRKRDVDWYMRSLEQSVIDTLGDFNLAAHRRSGRTGVWIHENRKIASIGVRISRWCTMHGAALNISAGLDGFSLINPCGFADITVTSMEQELENRFDTEPVAAKLLENFMEVFGYGKFQSAPEALGIARL